MPPQIDVDQDTLVSVSRQLRKGQQKKEVSNSLISFSAVTLVAVFAAIIRYTWIMSTEFSALNTSIAEAQKTGTLNSEAIKSVDAKIDVRAAEIKRQIDDPKNKWSLIHEAESWGTFKEINPDAKLKVPDVREIKRKIGD